jgi:NAD(P)-dependent dehydrogenase (short-subunit alcohol dehydrogenase family)
MHELPSHVPPAPPIALITGASGSIGRAVAEALLGKGWAVALVSRDEARVQELAETLGAGAHPYVADTTDPGAIGAAVDAVTRDLGAPLGLVHAVGSTLLKPLHAVSDEEFEDVLGVNLRSAFYTLRAFVRAVPRGMPASAVLFSTAATRIGLLNHEAIAAAKGGVDGLVTAAAATYASRGIRVNALAPGLVRSGLTRRLVENEATLRASEAMHPLGRIGDARDVAALAAFLVSAESSWITGQIIAVDGGLSAIKLPPPQRLGPAGSG